MYRFRDGASSGELFVIQVRSLRYSISLCSPKVNLIHRQKAVLTDTKQEQLCGDRIWFSRRRFHWSLLPYPFNSERSLKIDEVMPT